MSLFKRKPKIGADGFERKTVRGYVNKGPVAKMLAAGWEIEHVQHVALGGSTLKQGMYSLKRKAQPDS